MRSLVPRPFLCGLVNEVEFLGLIPLNGGDCEIANYYVALPLEP